MNHGDVKFKIGQDGGFDAAVFPDKARVFADADVVEAVVLPERFFIAQRAAGKPHFVLHRIFVQPKLPRAQIPKEQLLNAANLRVAREQRLHLIANAMPRLPIVVIPMQNNLGAAALDREISFRAGGKLFGQCEISNLRIRRHEICNGIPAVIHDDQLFVRIILLQKVFDRLRYKVASVASRHDAGDGGSRHRFI